MKLKPGQYSPMITVVNPATNQVSRISHCEIGCERTGGTAGVVRSARATGNPLATSRPPRATAEGRVLRGSAGFSEGRELLRQASARQKRNGEVAQGNKLLFDNCQDVSGVYRGALLTRIF